MRLEYGFPGFSVAQNMGSTFRKENKRHVSKKNRLEDEFSIESSQKYEFLA